jgi:hypothetical protein
MNEKEKFIRIKELYFLEDSEKKFFLGEEYITKIFNQEKDDEEFVSIELFEEVRGILENEFKILFQYFLSSKYSSTILDLYEKDNTILIPRVIKEFDYTEKDFQDPFVSDKDFDFCKAVNEDSQSWELLGKYSPNINTFVSNINVNIIY